MRNIITTGMAIAIVGVVACSSDTNSSGSSGTGTAQSGSTSCGSSTCQAGTYCVNEGSGSCTSGCTSNQNCPSGSTCKDVSTTTKVGTCSEVATKNCPAFIEKCKACGGGENCTQASCDKLSSKCVSCVSDTNCSDGTAFEKCGCTGGSGTSSGGED